jgi:hypothetical protein
MYCKRGTTRASFFGMPKNAAHCTTLEPPLRRQWRIGATQHTQPARMRTTRAAMRRPMHSALLHPSIDTQGINNTEGNRITPLRVRTVLFCKVLLLFCTLWFLQSIAVSHPDSSSRTSELRQPSTSTLYRSPMQSQNSTIFSHQALPVSHQFSALDIFDTNMLSRESVIPSNSSLQQLMHIPSDYDPKINTMWTCSDPDAAKNGRRNKLIFIHVFKTAGSTFRLLFAKYAVKCHAGYACAAGCSGLSRESVTTEDKWVNAFGSSRNTCANELSVDRKGNVMNKRRSITNSFLKDNVDVLIGHLPIGAHQYWMDRKDNRTVNAQYICFFREPIHKFVSGILFSNHDLSFDEVVTLIKKRVRDARSKGRYYEGYSAYLLSPDQKPVVYAKYAKGKKKQPLEYRIQLILRNMIDYHILIGIIERMSSSLELMLHVVDGAREMTETFQKVDTEKSGSKGDLLVANKSRLSTAAIIEGLRKDDEFFQLLQEYLKYDEIIYSLALKLHDRQYEWLQSYNNPLHS